MMVLHLGPAALIMRFSWLCPIILTHPCAFNVCEADNFVCIWRQKAPGRCPSPTSASPAPTGQSDIAGSGDNDNYNYAIHIRHLKMPGCAAGMLRTLFQLSGADNFFMVCYGRPSLVPSHTQASTEHCIAFQRAFLTPVLFSPANPMFIVNSNSMIYIEMYCCSKMHLSRFSNAYLKLLHCRDRQKYCIQRHKPHHRARYHSGWTFRYMGGTLEMHKHILHAQKFRYSA